MKYQTLKKRIAKIPAKEQKEETIYKVIWGSYETHSLIENDDMAIEEWEEAHEQAIGWGGT